MTCVPFDLCEIPSLDWMGRLGFTLFSALGCLNTITMIMLISRKKIENIYFENIYLCVHVTLSYNSIIRVLAKEGKNDREKTWVQIQSQPVTNCVT